MVQFDYLAKALAFSTVAPIVSAKILFKSEAAITSIPAAVQPPGVATFWASSAAESPVLSNI